MKKLIGLVLLITLFSLVLVPTPSIAAMQGETGQITGKSVCAGLLSFLVWPGIGQLLNECKVEKNWTHAILGLILPYRFWSGWDGLVDRHGGYWKGRI